MKDTLPIRIQADLVRKVQKRSKETGRTRLSIVNEALSEFLSKHGAQKTKRSA
jgi:predicted transcriptional regulator